TSALLHDRTGATNPTHEPLEREHERYCRDESVEGEQPDRELGRARQMGDRDGRAETAARRPDDGQETDHHGSRADHERSERVEVASEGRVTTDDDEQDEPEDDQDRELEAQRRERRESGVGGPEEERVDGTGKLRTVDPRRSSRKSGGRAGDEPRTRTTQHENVDRGDDPQQGRSHGDSPANEPTA